MRNPKRSGAIAALALLAACFILGLEGCGGSGDSPVKIRAGYLPIVATLPLFVAEEEGLFEREGIEVETVLIQNSNDLVNAMLAGQLDALPAVSLVPIAHLELQQPGRVRLFSHSRMRRDKAFDSILVKRQSEIHRLADLQDKKVGVFPGTSASNMLEALLARNELDPKRVTFVPLAPPAQLGSLESGAIDALFSYEPITTVGMQKGYRQLHGSVYAALQEPCPIGCSVISRRFERDHPEEAAAFIRAIDAAVELLRREDEKQKSLLPRFCPVPEDLTSNVNYVDVTTQKELDQAALRRFFILLKDAGETEETVDATALTRR